MSSASFKLLLLDVAEEKRTGVRHVRTPGGVAKYGQPIGSVITRDSTERAKRRTRKLSVSDDKPAAARSTINRVDAAARMHGQGSPQHRAAQRRWPDGGPKIPVAQSGTNTPAVKPVDNRTPEIPKPRWSKETYAEAIDAYNRKYNSPPGSWPSPEETRAAEDAIASLKMTPEERARFSVTAEVTLNTEKLRQENSPDLSLDEFKATLATEVKEAFQGKKVAVRVTPEDLGKILTAGRFKTQFETNRSKGTLDPAMRAKVENSTFGYTDSYPPENRPVYGYVAVEGLRPAGSGSNDLRPVATDFLSGYGKVQVVLRDDVRSRTTAMFGDSITQASYGSPSLVDNPDWKSFTPIPAKGGGFAGGPLRGVNRDYEGLGFRSGSYAEAQIHGGVSVGDIEEVLFPKEPAEPLQKRLDKAGVKWRVFDRKAIATSGSSQEKKTALKFIEQELGSLEKDSAAKQALADEEVAGRSSSSQRMANFHLAEKKKTDQEAQALRLDVEMLRKAVADEDGSDSGRRGGTTDRGSGSGDPDGGRGSVPDRTGLGSGAGDMDPVAGDDSTVGSPAGATGNPEPVRNGTATNGGDVPEPAVTDVLATSVAVGDRLYLDTDSDDGQPATVVGAERDGRFIIIDVEYDDGRRDSVWVHMSESVFRIGRDDARPTPAPAPEPDQTPAPDPDDLLPGEVAVSAAEIGVGDQIADSDGDPMTVVAVRKNRSTGLYDITTTNSDGTRDTNSFSDQIELARVREALVPDDLPDGVDTGRPALATYQRKNLAILDLDHTDGISDPVQQAAARIRRKEPVTAEQSAALAAHLNDLAQNTNNPRQQRSIARLAASVGAVDAHLRGDEVPVVRQADKMDKITVAGVTEGDWIAIRNTAGGDEATYGKVTAYRSLMNGRLREVTLTDNDGTETKRLLTANTTAFLLPDLAPPPPPPPEPERTPEKVRVTAVQRGDILQLTDSERGGVVDVTVVEVDRSVAGKANIIGRREVDGSYIRVEVSSRTSVTRVGAQPPLPIDRRDIKTGDTIEVDRGYGLIVRGQVTSTTGRKCTLETLTSTGPGETTVYLDPGTDVRLVTRDPDAAAQIERMNRERKISADTETISRSIARSHSAGRTRAAVLLDQLYSNAAPSTFDAITADKVREAVADGREGNANSRYHVANMAVAYIIENPEDIKTFRPRVEMILRDAELRAFDNAITSFIEAVPTHSDQTISYARREMIWRLNDPASAEAGIDSDATNTASRSLANAIMDAQKAPPPDQGIGNTVPLTAAMLGSGSAAAVARAKAAIGAEFGKKEKLVNVFAPTSIADLEAGKVPPVVAEVRTVREVAADNGPTMDTMRQLDLVKQAGAALRADVDRRLRETNIPTAEELQAELKAATAERNRLAHAAVLRQNEAAAAAIQSTLGMSKAEALKRAFELSDEASGARRNAEYQRESDLEAESQRISSTVSRLDRFFRSQTLDDPDSLAFAEADRRASEITNRFSSIAEERKEALTKARREALAEIRTMGGQGLNYSLPESNAMIQDLRWAESMYPEEWLNAAQVTRMTVKKVDRGFYERLGFTIGLSGGSAATVGAHRRVGVHELGHHMEVVIPGLVAAQEAFLWSRTSTGEVGSRKREKRKHIAGDKMTSRGYKDKFKKHYTGRTYEMSKDEDSDAFEVFTTGVESMFAGSAYMDDDPDFQDFMYGVLATL